HHHYVRYDDLLFDTTMYYLLSADRVDIAGHLLKRNPFLMSQHNQQALYFYYLGICQMLDPRGWPNFKQAEQSLNRAVSEMKRSFTPDYGFFSDVENARGYLSITARGQSTNEEKELVCIVRHEFIKMAIYHFREALIYNPENEFAQRNLDTLLSKLHQAGLPIPVHQYAQNSIINSVISFDSLNIDSLNNTSRLPLLDYSLLPKNYQIILTEISRYDEIILVLDLSGSMDDPVGWSVEASKFAVAQQLALYICLQLRANVFLGAISVGRECDTTSMVLNHAVASISREEITMKIDAIRPYGHTPLNKRLRMTKNMFSARQNRKLVFLLSDGMDTCNEIPDLCGTAAMLAAHGIDLSIFSFIYETLDPESRSAYSVYNCMVAPSEGTIYKITEDGGLQDKIEYEPVSNNTLILPALDTSHLWANNRGLYQFPIEGVVPPVEKIIQF
ncbi:MAG: VWA domain-containing protein, partial [Saprospiraceae bacterium]|nr:VWA domain-containing protein [Saprospiraceae bacterium]